MTLSDLPLLLRWGAPRAALLVAAIYIWGLLLWAIAGNTP